MFTKITHTKLFFPAAWAMLFVCTCFFCSCYTTDIIKPEPREIVLHSSEDIDSIELKNGGKHSQEKRNFSINYDSLFKKSAIMIQFMDTIKLDRNRSMLVYRNNPISLDSIRTLKYKEIEIESTILASLGIAAVGALVFSIVAAIFYTYP